MNIYIDKSKSIKNALEQMDNESVKLLIVGSKNDFQGLLTIGDVQRAILKNLDLSKGIKEILKKDVLVCYENEDIKQIKEKMLSIRAEFMPIISENNSIKKVVFWNEVFDIAVPPAEKMSLPVVVMAGGFGTRMRPLTHVIPKPLIPVGEKTILEEIFDRFNKHGCTDFHVSVNYKAELIQYYIDNKKLPYSISYFKEKSPMGTAGSLSLLKGQIKESFFISNCDILINQDYSEIYKYHKENNNEITLVAAITQFQFPYGTVETSKNGILKNLKEKPDFTFKVNSGMYILEPHLIDEVPNDKFFHITDLIDRLLKDNRRVGVFPIEENSWKDIGVWDSYLKQINVL